jgi:hypothetical protein
MKFNQLSKETKQPSMQGHKIVGSGVLVSCHPERSAYTFIKEDNHWYITAPEHSSPEDRSAYSVLSDGVHRLLDFVARGRKKVTLTMDTEPFDGADLLELTALGSPTEGGGYYRLFSRMGKLIAQTLWLCDISLLVFGDIPERIYIRREPAMAMVTSSP